LLNSYVDHLWKMSSTNQSAQQKM